MTISGFTFVRNGIRLHYPFVESIQSMLPLCDEVVVAVGQSDDGTLEAIRALGSPKIRIIETHWDEHLRKGGQVLAQQTNIALDAIQGDWGLYLQSDEVLHEQDYDVILTAAHNYLHDLRVDGLLFSWYNFYGNYFHIVKPGTRGAYHYEVRIIRNDKSIRSYRDAQGFRKFSSPADYHAGKRGRKLRVKKIPAHIYHYSKVRGPEKEMQRIREFKKLWHDDDWIEKNLQGQTAFEYQGRRLLVPFQGTHPAVMQERISQLNRPFVYDASRVKLSLKDRLLNWIEQTTGWRPFSFKNYIIC
ncbi:MAG: hypothetical protein KatS3mg031_1042 [Chitinophagales bacterium]|nr:MAG: hypothetical protein KatS3mg031_1042 [Chitinophagales bacterium]